MSEHHAQQNESKLPWGAVVVIMTLASLMIYYFASFMLHKIEAQQKAAQTAQVAQPVPSEPAAAAAALETDTAAAPETEAASVDGKEVYGRICAACHQADGKGNPAFPPLAGSEYVTGDPVRLTKIVLHGLTGPLKVAGKSYSSTMPAWGGALNDAETAAVLTYVRSAWGNAAPAIDAAQVAAVRQATAAQKQPYTGATLGK